MESINYYEDNAEEFYKRTVHIDMQHAYDKFEPLVKAKGDILDLGCGVGRDSKFFLSQGFSVRPVDGSKEMIRLCELETGIKADHLYFEDLCFEECFDAVWSSASLLHVPYDKTRAVLEKIYQALKPEGIFYASYKYGNKSMSSKGRSFYNMTEESILPYLESLFEVIDIWKTEHIIHNASVPSPDGSWLNILCRKSEG